MRNEMLTIGMATRGEPDLLWATLEALHAYHPRVDYLVIDNGPERHPPSEAAARAVGGRYLHRPDLTGTSAPRDAVFRYARTPWAMCIDAHVLLEPGAVRAALDWIERNPDSNDIVSGPIVWDDGSVGATHWDQPAPPGLWGTWALDERGREPGGPAFEIPMMGLGLWMMRVAAWPGFHPAFKGFGGEEGYIHEVVRRRGGRALCLPTLRWRHKFRDTGGWHHNAPPPYPLRAEDHARNLLIGHNELGIDAGAQIREHFGKGLPEPVWAALDAEARTVQRFGAPRPGVKRQRILALWYSDNTAPPALMDRSEETVAQAAMQARRHDVTISVVSWRPTGGRAGARGEFRGPRVRSHATIVAQIRQAVEQAAAGGETFDAVAFCEHDVLYPPDYFDRVGDALAAHPDAPVVSNLDYIGLNATGWQAVRERHEPLHQLCLRWDTFAANIERAEKEAAGGASVILEPDHGGDRSRWVRLAPSEGAIGVMPSVHVNHTAGRFTAHGDVCYHPVGLSVWHPHWGEAKNWWPGEIAVPGADPTQFKGAPAKAGGCTACEANKHDTPAKWADSAAAQESDFHEHVGTLRELAAQCRSAAELSLWLKTADAAIAAGLPADGTFTSVCRGAKPQWAKLAGWMGERFKGVVAEPAAAGVPPVDLLFLDTDHTAEALYPLLERHHGSVAKYIVVHCTETFGETGDQADGKGQAKPGVLHALRTFCHRHPEWVVKRRDRNNHGLMVLSKCPEDVKEKPSLWKQGMNYAVAMAKHVAGGRVTVPLEVLEQRQAECALCEERALDACAACGCPLEAKLPLASEACGLAKKGLAPKWGPWQQSAAA